MQTKTICTKALNNAAAAFVLMKNGGRHSALKGRVPLRRDPVKLPTGLDYFQFAFQFVHFDKLGEAMPQYTLTLKWLTANNTDTYDGQGNLNGGAHYRRLKAITVANQNKVTDPSGHKFHPYSRYIAELADGAVWQVSGTDAHICAMIKVWTGFNKVSVAGGPQNCPP
jgi:hypothetical protein